MVENFNLSRNFTYGCFLLAESHGIYRILEYSAFGRMIFIQNIGNIFISIGSDSVMSYRIEIELPNSGVWFKYFRIIDTLEEAESLIEAAEGKIKTRIRRNA